MTKFIPYPERRHYFNDADYNAACDRVDKKNKEKEEKYRVFKRADVYNHKSFGVIESKEKINVVNDDIDNDLDFISNKDKNIKTKKTSKIKRISINGDVFNTIGEAALILEMSVDEIFKLINDYNCPGWKYLD